MGENTKISWTNSSWNPWIGCAKVSPGCDHCYAETLNHRWGNDNWGKGKPRRVTSDANWKLPLRWDKEASRLGRQDMVFCASLADVMDDEAPAGQRERLWQLIDATPNLLWQLLTKRPQRYQKYLPADGFAHDNVILGSSAENQHFYDVRLPYLYAGQQDLECRNALHRGRTSAVKTFISYEPALGPLSVRQYPGMRPHWVICGGESGNDRRPMEQKWAEDLRAECAEFGISFFMKQMSARTPEQGAALIPASLLVREFPA